MMKNVTKIIWKIKQRCNYQLIKSRKQTLYLKLLILFALKHVKIFCTYIMLWTSVTNLQNVTYKSHWMPTKELETEILELILK